MGEKRREEDKERQINVVLMMERIMEDDVEREGGK